MTIPNENIENNYVGNGVATTFAYTFPIFEDADIVVTRADTNGAETVLALGTDYTVTGAGLSTGGNVVLSSALASNYLLNVTSNTAKTQTYDIRSNPTYRPDNMERALDRQVRMIQEVGRETDKAVRLAVTQTGVNPRLPLADAGKIIGWKEDGTGLDNFSQVPEALVGSAMEAVMTAGTLAEARSLMGPWGDALVTATGGTTARSLAAVQAERFNVRNYGAVGDGVTDDTAAIQAAANAIPTGQKSGVLYFPAGHYVVSSAITVTGKGCSIRGEGRTVSALRPSTNGSYWVFDLDASSVSGCSFDISDISIREVGLMNDVSAVRVRNCYGPRIRNVNIDIGGKCVWVENCADINLSDIVATSLAGDTVLRLKAVAGCVNGFNGHEATNTTWGSGSRGEKGPCLWLSGLTTSLMVSNSKFQGGGSKEKYTLTSIASTGTQFVVTLPATHTVTAGEWVFIDGCAVTAYNGIWKAESVTSNTITVLTTLNPGAASSGVCGRLRACVYIDSSDGAVNEVTWGSCLFEGWYTARETGAVSVYCDGENAPTANGIINHVFNGCYFDYGQTAMHLQGKVFSGTDWSLRGITVNGGVMQFATKCIYIQGAQHAVFTGINGTCQFNRATTSDQLNSSAIHIDGEGTGVEVTNRVRVVGCDFGPSVLNDTSFDHAYGLWLGGTSWDQLYMVGTHLFGKTSVTRLTSSATLAGKVAVIEGNAYGDGTTMTTADIIPSVASATTIAIGMQDVQNITGTTTITTINGGWPGREVKLFTTGVVTLNTGGNIANAVTTVAGQLVLAVFDGTSWHLR